MHIETDIAIVGGGAAGIGAMRALAGSGLSALLIEAGSELGGRARTRIVRDLPLDLGCGWLHSAGRNPWRAIAEASGFAVDRTRSAWRGESAGRGMSDADHAAAQIAYAAWNERLRAAPPASDRGADALAPNDPWSPYIDALSGFINGTETDQLSVRDYLAYDDAATDDNWRVREGYGTLVAAGLPPRARVALDCPVERIEHGGARLALSGPAGTVAARTAIVTVSTAVLASGAIRFDPPVEDHLHAASRLPLGMANKLYLGIAPDGPFRPETHGLGDPRRARTGSYYVMPFGLPYIECYYGGATAIELERAGDGAMAAFAREELAGLYGADARGLVAPLAQSAWRGEAWIGGAYSHALPNEAGQRRTLARPVDDRLFFAGEATHPTDFSTAHGALESGRRAAAEAAAALGRPIAAAAPTGSIA